MMRTNKKIKDNLAHQMKQFLYIIYFTFPSGKELIQNNRKGEAPSKINKDINK